MSIRSSTVGLALVLVVAAALRFYRLDFDLPEVQYVDGFKFFGEANRMADTGDLRPTDFQYPGLYVYVLVALYRGLGIASSYGRQLAALVVAALAGLALVGATAWAARGVSGPLGILVAAALVAVSPAVVTQSRTPAPDILLVVFMSMAFAWAARRPGAVRAWAGVGAVVGLATSAKWTGLFAAPVVAVAAAAEAWRRRSARFVVVAGGVGAATALVAFVATAPFVFPFWDRYAAYGGYVAKAQRSGQVGCVQLGLLDYLLSQTPTWHQPWVGTSLLADLGLPALVAAGAGLGLAATGRFGFAGGLYAATTVAYVVSISGAGWIKAMRFALPIVPLVSVLAGAAAEWALPAAARRRPVVWCTMVVALAGAPFGRSVHYVMTLRQPSTNALAREWMRANVPPGSLVFVGPFYTDDLYRLPFRFQWLRDVGARIYGLPPDVGASPERSPVYAPDLVDALRQAHVEYVVLNSYFDGAFSRVPENERFFPHAIASYEAFMTRLAEAADVVYARLAEAEGRMGPDIRVWRLKPVEPAQQGAAPPTL